MRWWLRSALCLGAVLVLGWPASLARAEVVVGAGLEAPLALLTAYDEAIGAGLVGTLDAAGMQINWSRGRLPGGQPTAFLTRGGAVIMGGMIVVDSQLADASGEALAALLAHEARHAVDLLQAGRPLDPAGCLESEIRAHEEQARAWAFLVGPEGRPDAIGLEQDLNELLLTGQAGAAAVQEWITARGLSRC